MIRVKATREGLLGQRTASGYTIDPYVSFVALPEKTALFRFVKLRNPQNGLATYAQVLDVGPWNTDDANYVFGGQRPVAESGHSVSEKGTNNAGIDLGERVWKVLGMVNNSDIEWEFI